MLRASVAASVAATYSLAQQARTAASSGSAAGGPGQQLAAASAETRSTVTAFARDMYERKIFEPFLRFASPEDEEAYRKREAETKHAIEEALKQNTPEGNLRAAELSLTQLKDAGAHGADKSPDFAPTMERMVTAQSHLSGAIVSADKAVKQEQAADFRDAIKPSTDLPADLIASIRATDVVVADQGESGHGLAACDTAAVATGRC